MYKCLPTIVLTVSRAFDFITSTRTYAVLSKLDKKTISMKKRFGTTRFFIVNKSKWSTR